MESYGLKDINRRGRRFAINYYGISENLSYEYVNALAKSAPTDRVYLDENCQRKLKDLWDKQSEGIWIPSDLVKTKKVPLPDVEIISYCGDHKLESRVTIFDNDVDIDGNLKIVGTVLVSVKLRANNGFILCQLATKETEKPLILYGFAMSDEFCYALNKFGPVDVIEGVVMPCVSDWYGVQIAMLHPQIKRAHFRGGKEKQTVQVTSKKRKTKYIQKLYINERTFKEATADAKRVYKCLAWYVCGHYRHYKNGTVQFIQGYWKGVMRDTKQNQDEGRIRDV